MCFKLDEKFIDKDEIIAGCGMIVKKSDGGIKNGGIKMGYASKIYVVVKSNLSLDDDGKCWGEVVAMFNACEFSGLPEVFKHKTDCFIYADDGDTRIVKDDYGDELTEAPISDVIKFLENEVQRGETYRRIKPLLGLLKGFDMEQWDNLVCLHYGY